VFPPWLTTRLADLAIAALSALGGWALSEWTRRRQDRAAEREQRRRACLDLVTAVGELQALLDVHRVQWLLPRPRLMTAVDALAEVVTAPNLQHGLPAAYRVVRRWEHAETEAGRSQTLPAVLKVNNTWASVVALGDPALTEAAQVLVDAAMKTTSSLQGRPRTRQAHQEALHAAVGTFGQQAGLTQTPARQRWRRRARP
jgi:hypothetical protein